MIKDKKTKTMARGHYKLEGKSSIHLTAHAHYLWMCNIKRKEKSGRYPIYNIKRICLNGFLSGDWNKKWRQEWRGRGGICRGGGVGPGDCPDDGDGMFAQRLTQVPAMDSTFTRCWRRSWWPMVSAKCRYLSGAL